jgi:two-component system sensor histidine kinase UhpB
MTLRLKINLIVGALTLFFIVAMTWLHLRSMRDSVLEEVGAANRVAAQVLNRTVWRYASRGTPDILNFLQGMGRVRANDITLIDLEGRELYRSPPATYKAGRDAPDWFEWLISPAPTLQTIEFPDGKLVVQANASRAVLDAWDAVKVLAAFGVLLLLVANALVFWLVGRTVRPFGRIVAALNQLQGGRLDVQLPRLPGTEAAAIGAAFNRMVDELQNHIETERRAVRAELQLSDSRDLTRWIDQHIERERLLIARELHDELGQSVTAIRSMALSIAQRIHTLDPQAETAARLIADESSRLYDAMHGMIPRLTPLVLDNFGLAEALGELLMRTRLSQPAVLIESSIDIGPLALASDSALTLYRAAQEGLSNALRHGQARRLQLSVASVGTALTLTLQDDGQGLPPDWSLRHGHYGLRWLAERAEGVGGKLRVEAVPSGGVLLQLSLPLLANHLEHAA